MAEGRRFVTCENSDAQISLATLLPEHAALRTKLGDLRLQPAIAFISYSSKDKEAVARIAADMRASGVPYWLDTEQIMPGDSVSKTLDQALQSCPILVACLSTNQISSGWARAEYASALASFLSAVGKRVIPLIVDDLAIDRVPALLRDLHAVRVSDSAEYRRLLESLRRGVLGEFVFNIL
jgi:hypothetical protein